MQTAALINEFDPSGPQHMYADKALKELYIQIKYVASDLRVGLEKASTISIPCETPGEQADVGDGYPGFC